MRRTLAVVLAAALLTVSCRPPGNPSTTTTTTSTTTSTVVATTTTPPTTTTTVPYSEQSWKRLKIGAGGWVTEMVASSDGSTKVVRTDTYGAYRLDGNVWKQLVTSKSMPTVNPDMSEGVYSIAISESQPSKLYMLFRGNVYSSSTSGDLWTKTNFPYHVVDANDNSRTWGEKMVVSPANPNVVWVGTPGDGLWGTSDGGATWTKVAALPNGAGGDSGAVSGLVYVGDTLYATVRGSGVWRLSGGSWSKTNGGPTGARHSASIGGDLLVISDAGQFWRYNGTWTKVALPVTWFFHSVAVQGQTIVLADEAGDILASVDGGATWPINLDGKKTISSPSIPWLGLSGQWMSNGSMRFDPQTPNKLWFSAGASVWTATFNKNLIEWQTNSVGIEQLVTNQILDPPGGDTLVANWDFGIFTIGNPDVYQSSYYPGTFEAAWSMDYSAWNPKYIAAVLTDMRFCCDTPDRSGFSTDGGKTWTKFPTIPNPNSTPWGFGSIAVSQPGNIVWAPSFKQVPYYTKDGGATWKPVNLPGADYTDDGSNWGYFLNRQQITADRVLPGVFYYWNSTKGTYRTMNGGDSWTLTSPPMQLWGHYNAKIESVPGKAAHLFYTNGDMSGEDAFGAFQHSTDGGKTWKAIPNVLEVRDFGFGKAAPGSSYPTIFIAGWVNNEYGIWRSINEAASWEKIGDYPLDQLSKVHTIEGDKDVFGKVYVGFGGNGSAYYG